MGHLKQWWALATELKHFTVAVANFAGLIHLADSYLISCTLAEGPSMLPTFNASGDVVLTERVSHRLGRIVPGDVIVVRAPYNPMKRVCKRVLSLEGGKVTFSDPQLHQIQHTNIVVPKGHVWIQGDNTYHSRDSRAYGPVPYGLIEGRVVFRDTHAPGLFLDIV